MDDWISKVYGPQRTIKGCVLWIQAEVCTQGVCTKGPVFKGVSAPRAALGRRWDVACSVGECVALEAILFTQSHLRRVGQLGCSGVCLPVGQLGCNTIGNGEHAVKHVIG